MPFEIDMSSKHADQPKPVSVKALKQQLANEIKARIAAEKRERALRTELDKALKRCEALEARGRGARR